ncbi:MAG TPA: P-loop NTPase fold protein [Armatimonadota bacterium]
MWSDNETDNDLLGFQVHADLLRSLVTDASMLPVTIGLFGDWGSGKSSIMRMLQRDLDPENQPEGEQRARLEKVAVLYFNGWTFEGYDDAKAALLSTILIGLGDHKRLGPKVRDRAVRLLKSVNWMRLIRLGVKDVGLPLLAAYASGGTSIVPHAAKVLTGLLGKGEDDAGKPAADGAAEASDEGRWEGLLRQAPDDPGPTSVRAFRDEFQALLKDCDIDSLVVLIDDLDRCSPERILDNLEAIKLFVNVERTAFVIGADPRIVRHAISIRYPQQDFPGADGQRTAERIVQDYLEKLIQVPYNLPRLSPAEVESYMTLLFCARDLDSESCGRVYEAARNRKGRERYAKYGHSHVQAALGADVPAGLASSLAFVNASAALVTEGLKGNPRQVKRFLNALVIRKCLAGIAELEDIRDDVLVKLQVLEYTEPDRFEELRSWQDASEGFPKRLPEYEGGTFEKGSSWAEGFPMKWLQMEPKLAGIDLRDYFWVARDRLADTFAGADLMPQVVRRALLDIVVDSPSRQKTAVQLATQMEEGERKQFLRTLGNTLVAKPRDAGVFSGFRLLIEAETPGAAEALLAALKECPNDSIPANVGLDLRTLAKTKPSATIFNAYLGQLAKSDTIAGTAMKPKASRAKGGT